MIEVAIIDDDEDLRGRIKKILLKSDLFGCQLDAGSLGDFFERLRPGQKIDVLLLDVQLDHRNSLDHLELIRRLLPDTKIIILTGYQDPKMLYRAMQDGAHSYFLKDASPSKLLEIIKNTYQGEVYLEPKIMQFALPIFKRTANYDPAIDATVFSEKYGLSNRETQTAMGILEGKSYKEIATFNHISLNTIRHYIKSLYRKLDVNSKIQLINKLKDSA